MKPSILPPITPPPPKNTEVGTHLSPLQPVNDDLAVVSSIILTRAVQNQFETQSTVDHFRIQPRKIPTYVGQSGISRFFAALLKVDKFTMYLLFFF